MFSGKSKWIWCKNAPKEDDYAEFVSQFKAKEGEKVVLKISCDSVYNVYLNGSLVAYYGCSDFPWYKMFDEIDITRFCKRENDLRIVVWHFGTDSSTYIKGDAGVIFEVMQGEELLSFSSPSTLSRLMSEYKNGYKKIITQQLGYSFLYDATALKSGYSESITVDKTYDLHKRQIPQNVLSDRLDIKILRKGNSTLIDMGREVSGFLDLDFESEKEQKILIAYGEHIADGGVRRIIGTRDFSVEYVAKAGRNVYLNALRRIAGRYLEIFSDEEIKINYIGIRPSVYPVTVKEKDFGDGLIKRIYDTSVATLRLCMHEHYEDCPWREQALYAMDSRNQMLCGYEAFEETEFQRHNILLISKSLRSDGLLSLTAPCGVDHPIPFFSLCFILQSSEYIEKTKDFSILTDIGPVIEKIFEAFERQTDDNGLIASFPYPCWNFYEWAEDSHNDYQITRKATDPYQKSYDLILNCMYVYVAALYGKIFKKDIDTTNRKEAIKRAFFRGGTFRLSDRSEKSSQLGNSLAILIGLGDEALAKKVASCEGMIPATLSMKVFIYDALLSFGGEYADFVIDDIKATYSKMLSCGATSFWETELGEADFDGAGSLCHGWSAIPILYLRSIK